MEWARGWALGWRPCPSVRASLRVGDSEETLGPGSWAKGQRQVAGSRSQVYILYIDFSW